MSFPPRPVRRVGKNGSRNSPISVLHCSPFECILQSSSPLQHGVCPFHCGRYYDDFTFFLLPSRLQESPQTKRAPLSSWSKAMAIHRKFTRLSKASSMDGIRRNVQEIRFVGRHSVMMCLLLKLAFMSLFRRHSIPSSFWGDYRSSFLSVHDQRSTRKTWGNILESSCLADTSSVSTVPVSHLCCYC